MTEGPRGESERGLGPWLPPPPPPLPYHWQPSEDTPFRPLERRARWAVALLALALLADLVAVVSGVTERGLLTRIADGEIVSDDEVAASDLRQGVVAIVQGLLYIAAAVAFLAWFFRAYTNLEILGVQGLRYGRRWAVGAWFVPFLNLFRPKQIANDIWRGSDPAAPEKVYAGAGPVPGLFAFWWAAFLVTGFLYNAASRADLRADGADELLAANGLWLAADVTSIVATPLAIAVVRRTTSRQEARAAALEVPRAELSTPVYRRGTAWATAAVVLAVVVLEVGLAGAIYYVDTQDDGQAAAGPAPAAPEDATLRAVERFDDAATGWLVDSGADFSMGYVDGEYRIALSDEGAYHSYVELLEPAPGLRIEVDARVSEGTRADGFGVGCWARDDAGYFASVYADRYYAIVKDPPGPDLGVAIVSGTARRRAVGGLNRTNKLVFVCSGTGSDEARLTLSANGIELASVSDRDPLLSVTGVGLFAASASGASEAAFDNLVVRLVDRLG